MKYNIVPIFIVKRRNRAFTSRGKAIDTLASLARNADEHIIRSQLLIKEGQSIEKDGCKLYAWASEPGFDDKFTICNGKFYDQNGKRAWTPYFLSYDDVDEYLENMGLSAFSVYDMELDTAQLTVPISPMRVQLQHDSNNRLFCRIQTNPNENGTTTPGKVFFPDRTWGDPGLGSADVSILKEMDSFGFVIGQMVDYTYDDLPAILDMLWKDSSHNLTVCRVESPSHGNFYCAYDTDDDNWYRFEEQLSWSDQTVCRVIIDGADKRDAREHIVWRAKTNDLFFSDAWGIEPGVNVEKEIKSRFSDCLYYKNSDIIDVRWREDNPLLNELVEEGYRNHIFDIFTAEDIGVHCCRLCDENIAVLSTFDRDHAMSMIDAANEVNRKADCEILAKIRKGRVRLKSANTRHRLFA